MGVLFLLIALAAEMAADRDNLSLSFELMQAADAKERDFHLGGFDLPGMRAVVESEFGRTGIDRVLEGLAKCGKGVRSCLLSFSV